MDIHVRKLPGSADIEEEFYLVSDVRELEADAMVMALRLYGENPSTFGAECFDVMQKWVPKIKAVLEAG